MDDVHGGFCPASRRMVCADISEGGSGRRWRQHSALPLPLTQGFLLQLRRSLSSKIESSVVATRATFGVGVLTGGSAGRDVGRGRGGEARVG